MELGRIHGVKNGFHHEDEFGTALATVDDRWGVLGARGNVAYLSDKWIAYPVDGHAHGIPIMDCADLRFRHECSYFDVLRREKNNNRFSCRHPFASSTTVVRTQNL